MEDNEYEILLKQKENLIQELYDFRLCYNALWFNKLNEDKDIDVYKSRRHSDGKLCYDGEWFIVILNTKYGQISNHYHIKYWDYFQIKEYDKVKDEYDGHTPEDVILRLKTIIREGSIK